MGRSKITVERAVSARMPAAMTEIAPMKLTSCVALLAVVGGSLALSAGHAETPEEWIKLGARVHGGFGAFIPRRHPHRARCARAAQGRAAGCDGHLLLR